MASVPPPYLPVYTARLPGSYASLYDRFWAKVDVGDTNACWPWTGAREFGGYGRIFAGSVLGHPQVWNAPRVAYVLTHGPLPPLVQMDHVCHTLDLTCPGGAACYHRKCVNPGHLEPVTQHENAMRREARRITCGRGHEYVANRGSNGPRTRCKVCHRIKMRHCRETGHYAWPGECSCHERGAA